MPALNFKEKVILTLVLLGCLLMMSALNNADIANGIMPR